MSIFKILKKAASYQILGTNFPSEDATLLPNFYFGDNSNYAEQSTQFIDNAQQLLVGEDLDHCSLGQPDDQKLFELPVQYDTNAKPEKQEHIGESSKTMNPVDVDYLLDEPFLDASDNPQFDDGAFLETNDLSLPLEADPVAYDMLEEYLTYFDADGDKLQFMGFDSSNVMEHENLVSDQASLTQEVNGETQEVDCSSQKLSEGHSNSIASTSKQELTKIGSDFQHPFTKQAHRMLGSIPAPPVFASEFPTKGAALHLNSASQSSSSVHVTAGIVQVRNTTLSGSGTGWSIGKHDFNVVLSFDLSRGDGNDAILEPMVSMLTGKAGPAISQGWFYFIFMWVLIISMSFKIGTCICAK
ncbi:unnamed protein product [Ilex paraguariensis]|uniref:Uncharacterized protein n=1 Tax=Ilex paraguariensis TaxID=185542 RepID=A0ABC8SWP3_9AQUA